MNQQSQQPQGGRPDRGGRPNNNNDQTRVNNAIRVPQVRCLAADGSQLGIMSTREALAKAQRAGLDLVEVSPNANPPVCRIMDYGKFKYEEERKRKEARKNQTRQQVKEIKFHANVDVADYQLKLRNIRQFLTEGSKVKLTLMFRGRENSHKELGVEVLERVCNDIQDIGQVEQAPKVMGRSVSGMVGPLSKTKKAERAKQAAAAEKEAAAQAQE